MDKALYPVTVFQMNSKLDCSWLCWIEVDMKRFVADIKRVHAQLHNELIEIPTIYSYGNSTQTSTTNNSLGG